MQHIVLAYGPVEQGTHIGLQGRGQPAEALPGLRLPHAGIDLVFALFFTLAGLSSDGRGGRRVLCNGGSVVGLLFLAYLAAG